MRILEIKIIIAKTKHNQLDLKQNRHDGEASVNLKTVAERKKIERTNRASEMWSNRKGSNACVVWAQKKRRDKKGAEKDI